MKKTLFLLLTAALLLAASCGKDTITISSDDDDCIDPPVLTDDMRFGCRINGEPWEHRARSLQDAIFNPSLLVDYQSNGWFYIFAKRNVETDCDAISQSLEIDFLYPTIGKNIPLSASRYSDKNDNCSWYYLDTSFNNIVHFTAFDSTRKVASGTFDIQLVENECLDTLNITEGRFNVEWQ